MSKTHPNRLARPIIKAAMRGETLTYQQMEDATGLPKFGLGQHLAKLEDWCSKNGLPPLTVCVVLGGSGRPSDGGTYRGVSYAALSDEELNELQAQCSNYDWMQHQRIFDLGDD